MLGTIIYTLTPLLQGWTYISSTLSGLVYYLEKFKLLPAGGGGELLPGFQTFAPKAVEGSVGAYKSIYGNLEDYSARTANATESTANSLKDFVEGFKVGWWNNLSII
jgi:hypothetical protein